MKRTLITSALPYANGYVHFGHCAGAYLPADIYARRMRMSGEDVLYVCGSDEHGVAITIAADKEKVTPQQIIDKYHIANKDAFERFGMSFDIFSRTSLPVHHTVAREFFADFLKKGFLVEREEEQFYDEKAKMFLPDRYVEGICPNCGSDRARGDQCDSCGAYYDQLELKEPRSLVSGEKPIVKKTTHWYLRFDMFQTWLEEYIEGHAKDWKENVLQQTRSWLRQGLAERAITRDLTWGVKLDGIEGLDESKVDGKALYVWFDAVLGYISATKTHMQLLASEGIGRPDDWKLWWQNPDTRYLAFIGKDNIVFHTLIFPAMLHARGENYILPDNVPANEFLNLEGQKFSKSRNWSIDLKDFVQNFPEGARVDALRYTLAMNFPETKDADFTWRDFQARNNNELASIFGNFANRALQFVHKNFGGAVPTLADKYKSLPSEWKALFAELATGNTNIDEKKYPALEANDRELLKSIFHAFSELNKNYDRFRFRDALTETMNVARAANKYFNDEEPWKSIKTSPEVAAKTLFVCMQLVRSLAVLFAPITPFTCKKINSLFEMESTTGEPDNSTKKHNFWSEALYPLLPEGLAIGTPEILFSRVEDETVAAEVAKLGAKEEPAAPVRDMITIDDFKRVELRTAKVISAEKAPKSKKLLVLQVEIGSEKRQILAGIAEHYSPEELVGKTVVVVANLQPAKLMGLESEGMVLAASNAEGKLCLVHPADESIGSGAEVR